jgi:DNA-binding MarR family transcriptional regulator
MQSMNPPSAARVDAGTNPASVLEARTTPAIQHGVGRLINRVRVELMDAIDRELAPYDITAPQLIVLASVANGEADSASGLCKTISYDPGAMTRMIDRLQQKGLVRRIPHPDDRRAMNLELTVAGKALYPQLIGAKETVTAQFLRGFNQEEIATLEGLLQRMLDNR